MRIGVFGGSFDPPHLGHLILAEQCREQANLDEIWLIPAARPPHKLNAIPTDMPHRVAMLELAIAGCPRYRIDRLEEKRPGPSYTADTLDELRERHPGHEWFYLLGSDSLPDLPTWHQPARIAAVATLLVMRRSGWAIAPADQVAKSIGFNELRMQVVDVPLIELASRDIRHRVAAGGSIRFMTPRVVEDYIAANNLYRSSKQ